MRKRISILFTMLLVVMLVTGCGCSKKKNENKIDNTNNEDSSVIKDQVFEGLEFVNVSIENGEVTTVVINNTGVVYEGSKFSIDIKDNNGSSIVKLTDEVKSPMESGTTLTVVTKTNADLSNAAAIEYSVIE